MRRREAIGLAALVAVAAGSLWWAQRSPGPAPPRAPAFPQDVDSYMTGVRISATDAAGGPDYRLESERVEHYPADDSTRLTRPHLRFFQGALPPWQLQARTGRMSSGGLLVRLQGAVVITREAVPPAGTTQMQTHDLLVNTVERTARTDQPVLVWHRDWQIDAVGLMLDLRSGLAEMFEVRGVYDPTGF